MSNEESLGGVGQRFMYVVAGLVVAFALALTLLLIAPPGSANASVCMTATSGITERKNISCKQARRVVRIVVRVSGVYPECRGDVAKARGWVARGIPRRGSMVGIKARFVKGNKSFLLSGGGTC